MPEWDQGYESDVPYTKHAFNFLSPAYVNLALALAGQPAPDLSKPFTYAELGSGFGLSIAAWAAQFPQGEFYSVDFNPTQTAWQLKLKERAGLANLHVFERSFGQMLEESVPPLDFIVVHGIYSWVVPEVRRDIRRFAQKFLKPGGAVYLGYNCQPGWSAAEPLRQIIVEGEKATGEKNRVAALNQGLTFLGELKEAGALFFQSNSRAASWLESWKGFDRAYLVGELSNVEHKPFFFSEMADDMAEAGATYVGSLDLTNYLEDIITPQDFLKRLNQVNGSLALRETVKDLLYDNTFRKDLFVRGPAPLPKAKAEKALGQFRLALSVGERDLGEEVSLKSVKVTLKKDVYAPVMGCLARGPVSVEGLANKAGLSFTQAAQAATVLTALDWAQVTPPANQAKRVKAFNAALAEVLGAESYAYVLSPAGAWLPVGQVERLYALALMAGDDPAGHIAAAVAENGWTVNHEGQPVPAADLPAFLAGQVATMDEKLRPILARLGCTE